MNAALFKKESLELWRTSRIIIAAVAFLILGLQGPILAKILPDLIKNASPNLSGIQIIIPEQKATDALVTYFSQMSFMPILVLILLRVGTLAAEKERGTQVLVLTKPVTRTQFILAKYFAYLGMLIGVLALTTLAVIYDTIVLFDSSFNFGAYLMLNLTLLSYLAFLLAVIILCSSLFKNSIAAGGVAFLAYLVISTDSRFLPNWPKYLPQVVFDVTIPRTLLGGQGSVTDLLLPTIVGIVLAILTLTIACYTYEQREM